MNFWQLAKCGAVMIGSWNKAKVAYVVRVQQEETLHNIVVLLFGEALFASALGLLTSEHHGKNFGT